MIPDSFIQDLLTRVDIVDVVGQHVALKKGGANLLGLCPFHTEKSPSFTVSPTKQFYHCFGCGAHGTAIRFLMAHQGASFPEAVRSLASTVGMVVPETPRSPRLQAAQAQRKATLSRHSELLEMANRHYRQQLKQAVGAINYLKRRGVSGEIAARFGLGWAGPDRQGLSQVVPDYQDALLVESGLVIVNDEGRRYDRFRERVTFPIRNTRGHLIGFGGRLIAPGEPKYLNSPETPVFSKGQELYGLWEARQAIRKAGMVVVVEGYMDVVALAQMGVDYAVATLGTATTSTHVQKLLRVADQLVFSFDGDAAGRKAAWRALEACLPLLRDDALLRFMLLPDQHDPDSFVREHGAQGFQEQIKQSPSLSQFLLEELARRYALNDAEGRARCIHEARPLIQAMPAGALRLQVMHELARMTLLTPDEVAQLIPVQDSPSGPLVQTAAERRPPQARPPGADGAMAPEAPGDDGYEAIPWDAYEEGGRSEGGAGGGGKRAGFKGANRSKRWGRPEENADAYVGPRAAVTPLANRLLQLLLSHPGLAQEVGEDAWQVLSENDGTGVVCELIELIRQTGARHAGALLEAAEGKRLEAPLVSASTASIYEEELPEPVAEWKDALRRVEIQFLQAKQSALVLRGLNGEEDKARYLQLARRLLELEKRG
ncbi:MAG: DNA primase [Pigmentiphaga sp.]